VGVPAYYSQTPEELESQLSEQLDHLQASAQRFDAGVTSERHCLSIVAHILEIEPEPLSVGLLKLQRRR
jgi:hypothetical protein